MLRCFLQSTISAGSPFNIANIEPVCIYALTMPPQITTLDKAKEYIDKCVASHPVKAPTGALFCITSSDPKFPDFDGLLVYTPAGGAANYTRIYGYQVKLRQGHPKNKHVPKWIEAAFLIKGRAAKKSRYVGDWKYLSEDEVRELLGVSLSAMYPAS